MPTIRDLFDKDIDREINGVIKAGALGEETIRQELTEYVITRELSQRLSTFVDAYCKVLDAPNDPNVTEKMGTWISGFFGSGKSHFLKVLSYLLSNRLVDDKPTIDYFEDKVTDPMVWANLKRMVALPTEVVLFNIDSHKDSSDDNTLLGVFLRVFNEMQGLCGVYPHIAHLERHLIKKGKYEAFKECWRKHSDAEWQEEREESGFHRDTVITCLQEVLGMSEDSAAKWADSEGEDYGMSIKSFAKLVNEYLDRKGADNRIIFLVDEVGQFIGTNGSLMLNLQTIAEELGTACGGRAWIIVTSQEDIDAVLGEMRTARSNDFSKIQGRFQTRLSLSSSNTDEVLQLRLLDKKPEVAEILKQLYVDKGTTLKNQLRFDGDGPTMPFWKDAEDFAACYPFPRHHFDLVQKIFESIRRVGAAGLHLSRGERSMMDAFQSAAQVNGNDEVGVLVPLYDFYECIETFLDTSVSNTITKAADKLSAFELNILRTLFLIRYNETVVKSTVDNLVTLCVDRIDADRVGLKERVESALSTLEKENLIQRNGNLYQFLTNEEQDVKREIRAVDISTAEEIRLVSEIVFEDILSGINKHRFKRNKNDYPYDRLCDGQVIGRVGNELKLEILTPLGDDYSLATASYCVQRSNDTGRVVIKIADPQGMAAEVRTYLQTRKYVSQKSDGTATPTMTSILKDQGQNNSERRNVIKRQLEQALIDGQTFIRGDQRDIIAADAKGLIAQAIEYLIENLYTKLGYIDRPTSNIQEEIKQTILTADPATVRTTVQSPEGNPQAVTDVRQYLQLAFTKGRELLSEIIARYQRHPYGWDEWETVLIITRLVRIGECRFMHGTATLDAVDCLDYLLKTAKWKDLALVERKTTGKGDLDEARKLGKELFSQVGPDDEDRLADFLRNHLRAWQKQLGEYRTKASVGKYPGLKDIEHTLSVIDPVLDHTDPYAFFAALKNSADDLRDLAEEEIHDLTDFYEHKLHHWDRLRSGLDALSPNRDYLDLNPAAKDALIALEAIRDHANPFGQIAKIDGHLTTASDANTELLTERRAKAIAEVDQEVDRLLDLLKEAGATDDQCNNTLSGLQKIKQRIDSETSIPHIHALTHDNMAQAVHFALQQVEQIKAQKEQGDKSPTGEGGEDTPPPAPPKKEPIQIRAGTVASKPYIESTQDIEDYLAALRNKLQDALDDAGRVRIV
jgi:ElaB/YqjD/DUF883 family membrane-anchored ribosome-binding protein